MMRIIAVVTAGVLLLAGVRAPEASVHANGFCTSAAVLEKAQDHDLDLHELRRTASDPTTLHSGFALSLHPFDVPTAQAMNISGFSENMNSDFVPSFDGVSVFPFFRPPIALFF